MANVFVKQPNEQFPVSADFVKVLETGETIDAGLSEVTVQDANGQDVTTRIVVSTLVSGFKLIATIKGGTKGVTYKITFKAVTSNSNIYELDVKMKVKDY